MKRKLSAALCTALVLAGLTEGCGDPETKPVQLEGAVYMETGNEERFDGSRSWVLLFDSLRFFSIVHLFRKDNK